LISNFKFVLFRTSTRKGRHARNGARPTLPLAHARRWTGLVGKSFQGLGPPAEGDVRGR